MYIAKQVVPILYSTLMVFSTLKVLAGVSITTETMGEDFGGKVTITKTNTDWLK